MRLYTPFFSPSTPFLVFYYKKVMFFLIFKKISLKTIIYILKIFLIFFKNFWVFTDTKAILGSAHPIFR
jgi:hypothetical protein